MDILLPMLALKGIELTLAASVIVILILMLRRFGRKWLGPRTLCGLWLLLLIKLCLPFSIPSPTSIENWTDSYLYERQFSVGATFSFIGRSWSEVRDHLFGPSVPSFPSRETRMYRDGEETWISLSPIERPLLESTRSQSSLTEVVIAFACVWIGGICIYAAIEGTRRRRTRRLIRSALPCEDRELLVLFNKCQEEAGIRGHVRLMRSGIPFPALHGLLRPVILLPFDYDRNYSAEDLRFILLHELMHFKHKDIFFLGMSRALQIAHWINPLVSLATHKYRDDLEIRCDSRVLQLLSLEEQTRYGMLLIRQGELNSSLPLPGSGANLVARHTPLAERIRMIANFRAGHQGKLKAIPGVCLCVVLAICLLPSNQLYAALYADNTPRLYAFWLDKDADPRSQSTLSSMAEQMSGLPSNNPSVSMLLKSNFESLPLEQLRARLRMLSETERDDPIYVDTRPIRDSIRELGLREGHVLIMAQYPYYYVKYWGFGVGKSVLTDLSSLERLEQLALY
ncbi:M56 family metallopeptidase [uncultured Paenibacillus sp.]|uniref:M56 family metallopeptidase n=1 Tax=uncultured Paenibacillus sp. TaxID=227322 RepID=UPI0015A8A7AF|nr:M56 family metallopeptidase [uncultured Paenibacillus sp.]